MDIILEDLQLPEISGNYLSRIYSPGDLLYDNHKITSIGIHYKRKKISKEDDDVIMKIIYISIGIGESYGDGCNACFDVNYDPLVDDKNIENYTEFLDGRIGSDNFVEYGIKVLRKDFLLNSDDIMEFLGITKDVYTGRYVKRYLKRDKKVWKKRPTIIMMIILLLLVDHEMIDQDTINDYFNMSSYKVKSARNI